MRQRGADITLLSRYFASQGEPLPLAEEDLFALMEAKSLEEQMDVRAVLARFWRRTSEGWRNEEADAEIAYQRRAARRAQSIASRDISPVFIRLPLVGSANPEAEVTEAMVTEWEASYPGVDVRQQLRHMREWCLANPTRQKTPRGLRRFIVGWLARKQDRGAMRAPVNGAGHPGAIEQFRRMRERGDL